MKKIYLALLAALLAGNILASITPNLHLYTTNVENRFEVGSSAKIFVEIMGDVEMPNGKAEIKMEGVIVGFPSIPLEVTKVSNNLYSFVSPTLSITDVGERYFQVQMKVRSKKTADRIKKAIDKNNEDISATTIALNNTTDEDLRIEYQKEITRLTVLNESLQTQLDSLFTQVGEPKDLGIRIVPKADDSVSVLVSESVININEGSTGEYSVQLSSRPVSDVVVIVTGREVELNNSHDNQIELNFTPENYNRPQIIKVKVNEDSIPGNTRQLEVEHKVLSRDSRYNDLPVDSLFINVISETPMPTVSFETVSSTTPEGSIVTFKAILSTPLTSTVHVPFIVCGTAEYPADHNLQDGELVFSPGETEVTLSIEINADQDDQEIDEDITIQLQAPTMYAALGENREYVIIVQALQFSKYTY